MDFLCGEPQSKQCWNERRCPDSNFAYNFIEFPDANKLKWNFFFIEKNERTNEAFSILFTRTNKWKSPATRCFSLSAALLDSPFPNRVLTQFLPFFDHFAVFSWNCIFSGWLLVSLRFLFHPHSFLVSIQKFFSFKIEGESHSIPTEDHHRVVCFLFPFQRKIFLWLKKLFHLVRYLAKAFFPGRMK